MADTNWQDFPDSAYFDPADILLLQRGSGGINIFASALIGKRSDGKFLAQGTSDNAPTLGARKGIIQFAGADAGYGLQIGADAASGASWLQSQRVDGAATAYNLLLNPAGGNVGIGTAPIAKLDVAQTSRVRWQVSSAAVEEIATNAAANAYADKVSDAATHRFKVSSTETVRISSAGLGVGASSLSPAAPLDVTTGAGRIFISASSVNDNSIASVNAANNAFRDMRFSGNTFKPDSDGAQNLGEGPRRWAAVYAATGTINTSDERAKQDIAAIPDEWLDAWGAVEWVRYKFDDAVEKKGGDARWHVGLIAQAVRDAFADRGLDARAIGLLCFDAWEEEREPILEEQIVDTETVVIGQEGTGILGPDGLEIMRDVTEERDVLGMVQVGERVALEAGDRWGLRYDECQAMEAAWQRRELARRDALIADLVARLEALEAA